MVGGGIRGKRMTSGQSNEERIIELVFKSFRNIKIASIRGLLDDTGKK